VEITTRRFMNNGLNPYAAGTFADELTEVDGGNNGIWQQKDIGAGLVLYGFYEFKIGKDKKTGDLYCTLAGISKLNILAFVEKAGFRKRYLKDSSTYLMVRVTDNIIEEVTPDLIRVETYNEMKRKKAITIITSDENEHTFNKDLLHTVYLKNQDQIFNKNFLELMQEFTMPELIDSKEISYFLFSNCIIKVDKDSSETIPYRDLASIGKCVWKSHITRRDYIPGDNLPISEFEKFICNVAGHDNSRISAFKSAVGYLLHNHNGSHMGQAIVCYDETPTDVKNPQGGTGKGLFAQGIAQMREQAKIDGRFIKADDKFRFQTVKVTSQVVFVDDLSKDIPFDTFFSCLTDGWTIERKNMDAIKITPEDSPKMLFSMNTVISGNGSSHKRRIFIIEFSDYYSKHIVTGTEHPIEDEHGILFDRVNWTLDHWNSFTKYMIDCLGFYLENGLQHYDLINVGKNTLIQTAGEDFSQWTEEKEFIIHRGYRTKEMFEEFRDRYYGPEADIKQRTFTNHLAKYAAIRGWDMKISTDPGTKLSVFEFKEKVK
jgi:hypothetical protein